MPAPPFIGDAGIVNGQYRDGGYQKMLRRPIAAPT